MPAFKLKPDQRSRRTLAVLGLLAGLMAHPSWGVASEQRSAQPAGGAGPHRSADARNRDVRIHNQTGWTMTYLFPSSTGVWSDNIMRTAVLAPGDSLVVTIDDGSGACRYALMAEFDNGQSLQRTGVDACQIADYYFTR